MLSEPKLTRELSALPRVMLHGPWVRAVGYHLLQGPPPGAPPGGPIEPLWPGGASLRGARFTPKGGALSLYLASDALTALIEVQAVLLIGGRVVPLATQPWALLSVDGVLTDIIDLTNDDIQKALDTTLSELTGDWVYAQATGRVPPTQALGAAAVAAGNVLGLHYPSAKNTGQGSNIAVFMNRLQAGAPSFLQVVDPHKLLAQRVP